jgi:rhodanese-related sulfurtransferase
MIKSIPVQEAHQRQREDSAYLDVRSTPEFDRGHPQGAYNIPLLHLNPATRQMTPNPDFLAIVQATFPADTKLVIGCQAGTRSMQACQLLASAGYTDVANVAGGFGGSPRGDEGWAQAGLPVETSGDPSRTYDALRARAQGKAR